MQTTTDDGLPVAEEDKRCRTIASTLRMSLDGAKQLGLGSEEPSDTLPAAQQEYPATLDDLVGSYVGPEDGVRFWQPSEWSYTVSDDRKQFKLIGAGACAGIERSPNADEDKNP